MTTCTIG